MDRSAENKVFVGGLSQSTDKETLKDHFKQFGEVVDAVVMYEKVTKENGEVVNKSRGFGFVTFSNMNGVRECLGAHPEELQVHGVKVEVKRAIPMEELRSPSNVPTAAFTKTAPTKKVFLGGLPVELTREQLWSALTPYGDLIDVHIATAKGTEEPRGFGFAIFDKFEKAKELCDIKYIKVLDKQIEVKPAVSKEEMKKTTPGGGRETRGGGPPEYSSYGAPRGGGDPYTGRDYYRSVGASYAYPDYRGYDYSRYDYMRGYGWGGGYDRGQSSPGNYYKNYAGYDMSAYNAMYPPSAQGMGTYSSQSSSSYGPSRDSYGGGGDKDRSSSRGYHPYRR